MQPLSKPCFKLHLLQFLKLFYIHMVVEIIIIIIIILIGRRDYQQHSAMRLITNY